ncbi:RNA-directed DNA polymerase, eukaryota, reverse transcriptase zinc-binding domain protein [Tanacetum coccineum]
MSQKNRSYKRQVKLYVRYHDLVMENSSQRDDHNRSNDIDIGLGTNEVGNRDLFKECEGNEGAKMNKGVFANGDNDSRKEGEINESDEVFGSMEYSCEDNSLNISDKQIDSEKTDGNKVTNEEIHKEINSEENMNVDYPNIGLERKEETEIPLWAKIKNVSLKAWTKDGINALASSLGKTLRMDNITAHACQAEYQWKLEICSHCMVFGHSKSKCSKLVKSNVEKSNNVDIIDESSGRSKEDEGFVEVRDWTIQDEIPSAIKKSKNKYDVLEEEEIDEGKELKQLKDRMIVDQYLNMKRQPTCSETYNWSKDMIQYFKHKWEEDRMKENKDQKEDIKDVMEEGNICAKMCSANEVSGMKTDANSVVLDKPWVMLGDFNVTMKVEEHSSGGSQITSDMQELIDCSNDDEIENINSTGLFFTWIKSPSKPETSVMKKLDRILVNGSFMTSFNEAYGQFMPFIIFDHSVALLIIPKILKKKERS